MGLFKTYAHPATAVVLTDENTVFVSSIVGTDLNSGLRALPVGTITKRKTLGKPLGKNNLVLSGDFNENINLSDGLNYIGDGTVSINGTVT